MLAGLPGTPNESSEHKERLAALLPISGASVLANARLLRKPKERTVPQRFNGFARGLPFKLQRGPERGGDLSAVPVAHGTVRSRHTSLRAMYEAFLGFSYIHSGHRLQ